jgi:hypothetical protein
VASAKICPGARNVIAMSGTAMEVFDAGTLGRSVRGAAEADRTIPPLIRAKAGSVEQILRKGTLIVRT